MKNQAIETDLLQPGEIQGKAVLRFVEIVD